MDGIKDFVKISRYAGMREDLIQASGGNTSLKLANKQMVIKSSGIQLADITENQGFSVVACDKIECYLENLYNKVSAQNERNILEEALIEGSRPSIEIFLHATTDVLTLHSHPVAANVLLTRTNGMDILKKIFPDALIVEYATPGLELAEAYYYLHKKTIQNKIVKSPLIFLKNHGVIISAKNADEVIELNESVISRIEEYLDMDGIAYHNVTKLWQSFCKVDPNEPDIIYKVENKIILDLYEKKNFKLWRYQFSPDNIVFCGKTPLHLSNEYTILDIKQFINQYGSPHLIEFHNMIYIKAPNIKKAKEIESILAFSAAVIIANEDCKVDMLSESEQNFLLNCDAEKYRQQMK